MTPFPTAEEIKRNRRSTARSEQDSFRRPAPAQRRKAGQNRAEQIKAKLDRGKNGHHIFRPEKRNLSLSKKQRTGRRPEGGQPP